MDEQTKRRSQSQQTGVEHQLIKVERERLTTLQTGAEHQLIKVERARLTTLQTGAAHQLIQVGKKEADHPTDSGSTSAD